MSDPYLINIQPGDDRATRRVIRQRWIKEVATQFSIAFPPPAPLTGGYLIDLQPGDVRQTSNCADAAWVKNIFQQI